MALATHGVGILDAVIGGLIVIGLIAAVQWLRGWLPERVLGSPAERLQHRLQRLEDKVAYLSRRITNPSILIVDLLMSLSQGLVYALTSALLFLSAFIPPRYEGFRGAALQDVGGLFLVAGSVWIQVGLLRALLVLRFPNNKARFEAEIVSLQEDLSRLN